MASGQACGRLETENQPRVGRKSQPLEILVAQVELQRFAQVAERLVERCSLRHERDLEAFGDVESLVLRDDRVNGRP